MLGLDGRVLRAMWTVFLFALIVALLYLARETLIIFTLAIFLAHLLGPLVDWVERFIPQRISRNVSLALVYLALMGAAAAILIAIGAKIGEQAAALAAKLPDALKGDLLSHVPLPAWLEEWRPRVTDFLRQQNAGLNEKLLPMLRDLGPGILAGLGSL